MQAPEVLVITPVIHQLEVSLNKTLTKSLNYYRNADTYVSLTGFLNTRLMPSGCRCQLKVPFKPCTDNNVIPRLRWGQFYFFFLLLFLNLEKVNILRIKKKKRFAPRQQLVGRRCDPSVL